MKKSSNLKKTLSIATISLFIFSMFFATVPLVPLASATETPVDLTPDYAKAGDTIPILSFEIVGPTGGTTLTSVTIAYTGTDQIPPIGDLLYAAIYVDGTLFGWIWQTGLTGTPPTGTITGSYAISAGVTATVKLVFTLSASPTEGNTVDGKVTNYVLTVPPGVGTDAPPIDPAGVTIIDNTPPTVELTAPLDNAYINTSTYTVTATASDNTPPIILEKAEDGVSEWTTTEKKFGTCSAKLSIPTLYTVDDVARVVVTLSGLTLNGITSLSYWYYVDPSTPATSSVYKGFIKTETAAIEPIGFDYATYDVYGAPYLVIELDANGDSIADTWVIQAKWGAVEKATWVQDEIEATEPFHVATLIGASLFPIGTEWGSLTEVKAATVDSYSLGSATVLKVKLAIGEWDPTGPTPPNGPVVVYVDDVIINGNNIPVEPVASVSFYYSLAPYTTWTLIGTDTTPPYSVNWDLSGLADQTGIKVKAKATDIAGNTAEDINTGITLDRTAPTISNLTPPDGAYVNTATPTISAILTNGVSGIDPTSIVMKLDDVSPPIVAIPDTDYTYDPGTGLLSFTPATGLVYETLADGIWYVTVDVSDYAVNPATTASWSFTVDTIPPTIQTTTLIYPNGGESFFGGDIVYILWDAGDITDVNLGTTPISLYYSTDGGITYPYPIATNEANDGSYTWTVPYIISTTVKVNITATDLAGNSASDESDAVFEITYTPVLTTVDVTAVPPTVFADGIDASTITAIVTDQYGLPMAGRIVYFTTTLGTLSASSAVTGPGGTASVTLTSTLMGTATVTATADSKTDSTNVEFIGVGGTTDIMNMLNNIIGKLWSNVDSLKNETKAIEDKLDGMVSSLITQIWGAVDTMEADLKTWMSANLVTKTYFDSIIGDLTIGGTRPTWTDIASALDDVKNAIDAIKVQTDTIDWADITDIKNWVSEIVHPGGIIYERIASIKDKTDTINWADITALTTAVADIEDKLDAVTLANIDLIDDIKTWLENPANIVSDVDLAATKSDIIAAIQGITVQVDLTPVLSAISDLKIQLETKLDAVRGGDVIASKYENNRAVTSASPYIIGGLPANKVFRGTITLEIDTALGTGQRLFIDVWDGDSWARVWTSAANAAAGTSVSINIAGITDSAGNAIRIVTTSTASRNFDYVFAYQIDIG